jgi:hypothetical protein
VSLDSFLEPATVAKITWHKKMPPSTDSKR